jgi:hypothetical protein
MQVAQRFEDELLRFLLTVRAYADEQTAIADLDLILAGDLSRPAGKALENVFHNEPLMAGVDPVPWTPNSFPGKRSSRWPNHVPRILMSSAAGW